LPVFYYIIGLILYAWVIIAFYPSIQKNINLDEYLKQMPEQFIKFFSGGQTISYSTIEGFLSMEFLSLFFILVIIMFIGAYAGSTIAGSIEKKTLDFQLSQPISRTKLVLADTVVGLAGVFLIVVFTTLAIDLICHGYNISINSRGLLAFAVIAAVFLWAFYGIALLLSSFLKSKMAVTMATLLIVLAFYIFTSLTNIVDRLKDFEKFSLFYIYKTQEILSKGEIHWSHVGILFLIFGLGLVGSLVIFNRRDV
jgi:ABC-2 type transport system permease protein